MSIYLHFQKRVFDKGFRCSKPPGRRRGKVSKLEFLPERPMFFLGIFIYSINEPLIVVVVHIDNHLSMLHVFFTNPITQQYMLHPVLYVVISQLRVFTGGCQDNFRVYAPSGASASRASYCGKKDLFFRDKFF